MIDEKGQYIIPDPLRELEPSLIANEGDHVVLNFSDGRHIFAEVLSKQRGKTPPVKINKHSFGTNNLIGLSYGAVLELGRGGLVPLLDGEDVIPRWDPSLILDVDQPQNETSLLETRIRNGTEMIAKKSDGNVGLINVKNSQSLLQSEVERLRQTGVNGSSIVKKIVSSSSTFASKTKFSKHKYITRKQIKYQQRCRMIRCTPTTVCAAMFSREPRKVMNLREDTLAQILSYANICAGSKVLVFDTVMGLVVGSLAHRMGGYGEVISLFTEQQPAYSDIIARFNLSFAENKMIRWVHTDNIFGADNHNSDDCSGTNIERSVKDKVRILDRPYNDYIIRFNHREEVMVDYEIEERNNLVWPCPLHKHTRKYLESMNSIIQKKEFLDKRSSRFIRKLTRHTTLQSKSCLLMSRACDSLILACKFVPVCTLLTLLPYLSPSCPFVVHCEYLEPLLECFQVLQSKNLAVNIRLSDTWMRDYQVLPGRTHPNMNMSQSGGFILWGLKLCPVCGTDDLNISVLKKQWNVCKSNSKRQQGKKIRKK